MTSVIPLSGVNPGSYARQRAYNRGVQQFGERLKRLREALGLSQREVARRAVTGRDGEPQPDSFSNYLSKIENGTEDNPSLEFLERTAAGLGLTLSEFFTQISTVQSPDARVTLPPSAPTRAEHHQVPGVAVETSLSPESDSQRLAALCLRAADRSERQTVTGILSELAHAFQIAALDDTQWEQYKVARRQITDRRAEASSRAQGDRSTG